MKGKSFEIKVSDLLHHLGTDSVEFEGKTTDLLPQLSSEGMSGTLSFSSVDGNSVLVSLQHFGCVLEDSCDSCGGPFLRNVHVENYVAKFTLDTQELADSSDEVLFLIDPKNETIDVEEMLYQAVLLQDPFVKRCGTCEISLSEGEIDDEVLGDDEYSGGVVQFRGL